MRRVLGLMSALTVVGLSLAFAPSNAGAAFVSVPAANGPASLVQKVDWVDRYYRRNGYYPPGYAPPAPVVVVPADPALNPPIMQIVPVRPASCGEYRYWDGERCLDARFNKPYLGPR